MKVCIYYNFSNRIWGGANSFLGALNSEFLSQGIEVTTDTNSDYDILFVNSASKGPQKVLGRFGFVDVIKPKSIRNIKKYGYESYMNNFINNFLIRRNRKDKKIVHRLDGVTQLYGRDDPKFDELQLKVNSFVDYTIFQSKYCLTSFMDFGFRGEKYSVIYNGVDQKIFNMNNKEFYNFNRKLRMVSCSWSGGLLKGFETIAEFSQLPNVECYFIGRWREDVNPENVKLLGVLPQTEVAKVLRSSDVFLHPAKNDPCPNVISEALSCGLPVIYHPSGGTPELASDYGVPLMSDPGEVIENMLENYENFVEKIKHDMDKFSIITAAKKYAEVFYAIV